MITLKNILVATDFGEASDAALLYGRSLAHQFSATLHVLHVVDDLAAHAMTPISRIIDVEDLQREREAEARGVLGALVPEQDRTAPSVKLFVLSSPTPALSILSYAQDVHIDLIVMGTHGREGIAHFLMGSVAQKVVRAAPCPVLTVRRPEREFVRPDALQVAGVTALARHA